MISPTSRSPVPFSEECAFVTYLLMLEPLHQRRGQVVELVREVSDAQQHFGLWETST